ncbi:MAG: phosphate/phosphite/phosphonate ABC transporter substrate-binding protein [Deltaproteobacteria bacterium]|nr:phosphate/phosphite/phosphonate ABC transporter substrate-binding protein [Deltaproteobacteria bacterium]
MPSYGGLESVPESLLSETRVRRAFPRFLAFLFLFFAFFTGCGQRDRETAEQPPPETTLLIGLIPEQNIFKQIERYEPLADYLSKKAGVRIKLKVLTYYGNVIDNFEALKLDGAFFGSFGYSLAKAKLGVEVLARPEEPDGTSTYHGVIFVRKNSGIRTVGRMKGKRLALVARATTAGYLFPLIHMKRAGVGNIDSYFGDVHFTGTHEGTVRDVLENAADIGAAKNTVFKRLAAEDPRIGRELTILARSADVPENGLALRKTLEDAVKRKISEALVTMHADPEGAKVLKAFGARSFIRTTDADYEPVLSYTRELGIDLATYRFSNE